MKDILGKWFKAMLEINEKSTVVLLLPLRVFIKIQYLIGLTKESLNACKLGPYITALCYRYIF